MSATQMTIAIILCMIVSGQRILESSAQMQLNQKRGNYEDIASLKNGGIMKKTNSLVIRGDGHPLRENYLITGYSSVTNQNSFIIELMHAYEINSIKFLLWDGDTRTSDLTVEISYDTDYTHFKKVYDSVNAQSWQTIKFVAQNVKTIRLNCRGGSSSTWCDLVKLQAFYEF